MDKYCELLEYLADAIKADDLPSDMLIKLLKELCIFPKQDPMDIYCKLLIEIHDKLQDNSLTDEKIKMLKELRSDICVDVQGCIKTKLDHVSNPIEMDTLIILKVLIRKYEYGFKD